MNSEVMMAEYKINRGELKYTRAQRVFSIYMILLAAHDNML